MGNINVREYLTNLDSEIDRKYGSLYIPKRKILKNPFQRVKFYDMDRAVGQMTYKDIPMYYKVFKANSFNAKTRACRIACEVFLSRLYDALGVNSIIYYPVSTNLVEEENKIVVSQDISKIDGLDIKDPREDIPDDINSLIYNIHHQTIKQLIDAKSKMEENGTLNINQGFFDDFLKMLILDKIFMQTDRHSNFFLAGNELGETVIAYDNERNGFNKFVETQYEDFKTFLKSDYGYSSWFYIGAIGEGYPQIFDEIKRLHNTEQLNHIIDDIIKRLKEIDIRQLLSDACCQCGYSAPQFIKDQISFVVDNAQENLCK